MTLAVVFLSEHRGFPLPVILHSPSSMTATGLCNRLGQYTYFSLVTQKSLIQYICGPRMEVQLSSALLLTSCTDQRTVAMQRQTTRGLRTRIRAPAVSRHSTDECVFPLSLQFYLTLILLDSLTSSFYFSLYLPLTLFFVTLV